MIKCTELSWYCELISINNSYEMPMIADVTVVEMFIYPQDLDLEWRLWSLW